MTQLEIFLLEKLAEIGQKLTHQLEKTMKTVADLDASIATLKTGVDALAAATQASVTASKALVDKITAAGTPTDLQAEVDAVNAANASVGSAAQALADQTAADANVPGSTPPVTVAGGTGADTTTGSAGGA